MSRNGKTLVQFQDETNSTTAITLLSNDDHEQLPMMSYVITGDSERQYFGQVQAPALWLNQNAAKRYEPASLDTMQRIDRGEFGPDAFFRLSQFYTVELLSERGANGDIIAPMTRPKAGGIWRVASAAEAITSLTLPQDGYIIGHIAGITTCDEGFIPVRLNAEILRHHLLVAGVTGHGKSNTNVQIVCAAQKAGFCVLIYDMKPDYIEIDEPNDETQSGLEHGLPNVRFWTLARGEMLDKERPITVYASDVDPAKLAQVAFYRQGEELQLEVAEQLISGYADLHAAPWSINEFMEWLHHFNDATAAAHALPFKTQFNAQTFNAVRQKIGRPGRVPSWIDAGAPHQSAVRQAFGATPRRMTDGIFTQLQPGAVHVIRVRADQDGRSYALFLDYAMRKAADMRRAHTGDTPPILHVIDEAGDLFKNSNRRLAQSMENTVNEQVRKGRSLSIGFVLSAQSAEDVPEAIRHNLNSMMVFRHKHPKKLQEALPAASDAMHGMAAKLRRGEALVELFGASGVLRCRMHQSPAKLFKPRFEGWLS